MSSQQKLYRQFRKKCFFTREEARFYVRRIMDAARRIDEKLAASA